MKKVLLTLILCASVLCLTGCVEVDTTKDEQGNEKTTFNISETAIVNNAKIKINSVKKIKSECAVEYSGSCYSTTNPENDFFLVIDLTIENNGSEELAISSMLSFDLKDSTGEQGKYALLTKSINSQLDGSIMANDLLKGQIAYDVKQSNTYNFYFKDNILGKSIKFTINISDISE